MDPVAAPVHNKVKGDDDEVVVQDFHGVLAYPETLQNTSRTDPSFAHAKFSTVRRQDHLVDLQPACVPSCKQPRQCACGTDDAHMLLSAEDALVLFVSDEKIE